MSLRAKILFGCLLIWFIVLLNQHVCDRCCVTEAKRLWGWCYVTKTLMLLACYLSLSSDEFINTSSHMCGSWYLPTCLLRHGSLTLMKMASLMDLAKFWSSSSHNVDVSMDISWPVVLWSSWMGDGAFMCSLYLSANILPDSPNIFFFTVHSATLLSIYHPTFLPAGISVLGFNQKVPDCPASLKVHVFHVCFRCFHSFHLNPWCKAPLYEACWCWC